MTTDEQNTAFVRRPHRGKKIRKSLIRIVVIAGVTAFVCWFLLRPMRIDGASMMPTYSQHGFTFCVLPYFHFAEPHRGQIVILSLAGNRTFLLKRVLAFPGETVSFRNGVLYVNDAPVNEQYVKLPCSWELPSKTVPDGKIFVVGDNRSMPIKQHMGGMIDQSRLAGVPLW